MISLEQLNNALQGFQQRYFKEKAETYNLIKEIDLAGAKAMEFIEGLEGRIKILEDAREEQIKVNSELEKKFDSFIDSQLEALVEAKPKSIWERYFKG